MINTQKVSGRMKTFAGKELFTGKGCVGVVIPWQLCRTIGPLTLHSQEIL